MKTPPVKLDNPSAALLISSLRRAARVPLCPMCATPRQMTADGLYCPGCRFHFTPPKGEADKGKAGC